jgi:hypothetical protein
LGLEARLRRALGLDPGLRLCRGLFGPLDSGSAKFRPVARETSYCTWNRSGEWCAPSSCCTWRNNPLASSLAPWITATGNPATPASSMRVQVAAVRSWA